MQPHAADQFGIDILTETSFGWWLTDQLDTSGYYIAYKEDGTTPVNVLNSFAWLDDLDRKDIVRKEDYTNYRHQMVMPIISYDFLSDTAQSIELGTPTKRKIYSLSLMVSAENKAQTVNLAGFISSLLETYQTPIYNYNKDTYPQIGVITYEDLVTTRLFDVFSETNLAKKFLLAVTCDAVAEFNNNFER